MHLAGIDFGSNSLRLLIAQLELHNSKIYLKPLVHDANINQLGNSLHTTRMIKPETVEKSHLILNDYLATISKYNCVGIYAVATSVFRDALNGETVKKDFEHHINTSITTLSGQQEAKLFFNGILTNRTQKHKMRYGCFDIGGGSTEYIVAQGTEIQKSVSLQIGCLRTKQTFFRHNPPKQTEIVLCKQYITDLLNKQIPLLYSPDIFFGFGGTITTLARIITNKNINAVENCILHINDIYDVFNSFSNLTDSQIRKEFSKYINVGRETVIRAGILIVIAVMECLNSTEFTVTNQGILFGLLRQKYHLHTI